MLIVNKQDIRMLLIKVTQPPLEMLVKCYLEDCIICLFRMKEVFVIDESTFGGRMGVCVRQPIFYPFFSAILTFRIPGHFLNAVIQ